MTTPQERVAELIARASAMPPDLKAPVPQTPGAQAPVPQPPVQRPPVAQPPAGQPPVKVSLLEIATAALESSQLNAQMLANMAPTIEAIGQAVLEIHQALYQQAPHQAPMQSDDDF